MKTNLNLVKNIVVIDPVAIHSHTARLLLIIIININKTIALFILRFIGII